MADEKQSILLIEDNTESRKSMADYLRSQNFNVHEASGRDDALNIWGQTPIDVVVVEQNIAGTSGIELLEEFGGWRPDRTGLRAVLTSAVPLSQTLKERLSRIKKTTFITKPFQLRVLRNKVLEVLDLPPLYSIPPDSPTEEEDRSCRLYQRPSLPMEGYLIDSSLPMLFHGIFLEQFTGVLHLDTDEGSKRIYFSNGLPIYAESNVTSETLGAFLLRKKVITQEQNDELISKMQATGQRQGEILIQNGMLSPHQLFVYLEAHIMEKINTAFDLVDASFRLTLGDEWVSSIVPVRIPAGRLIIDAIKRSTPPDQVWAELELAPDDVPFNCANQLYTLDQLRLGSSEMRLKRLIEKRTPIDRLLSTSVEQRKDDLQLLYAFYVMQMVGIEKGSVVVRSMPSATSSQPSRESDRSRSSTLEDNIPSPEAQAMLAEYLRLRDSDYYTLLGVNRHASGKEIDAAYHRLLPRYHPDSLARLGSPLVQEKLKELFIRIQEGLRILKNEKSRAIYDENLTKLSPAPPAHPISTGAPPKTADGKIQPRMDKVLTKINLDEFEHMAHWQLFSRGRHSLETENYEEAMLCFRIASKKSSSAKYKAFEAWAFFLEDPKANREKAEDMLEKSVTQKAEDAIVWYVRGMICAHEDEISGAIACFEKTTEIDPNNIDAARQLRHLRKQHAEAKKKSTKTTLNMDIGDLFRKFRKK